MAIFDDFPGKAREFADVATDKARELADAAVVKAREAADAARLRAAILSEQRALNRSCRAVGEWYLSQLEGDAPADIAETVAAARASEAKLAELRAQRQKDDGAEDDGLRTCPLCGERSEGKFCPQCGAPLGD